MILLTLVEHIVIFFLIMKLISLTLKSMCIMLLKTMWSAFH